MLIGTILFITAPICFIIQKTVSLATHLLTAVSCRAVNIEQTLLILKRDTSRLKMMAPELLE
jgi:hypothetical protein